MVNFSIMYDFCMVHVTGILDTSREGVATLLQ